MTSKKAGYKGNPGGKDIYPHEVDHGYNEPLAGGTDVMRQLQNRLLYEQGREQRPESPHLASLQVMADWDEGHRNPEAGVLGEGEGSLVPGMLPTKSFAGTGWKEGIRIPDMFSEGTGSLVPSLEEKKASLDTDLLDLEVLASKTGGLFNRTPMDERQGRFEEGVPADPTENMTEEDRKKWWEEHQKNKDKFKQADVIFDEREQAQEYENAIRHTKGRPQPKDYKRIEDMGQKAKGNPSKLLSLANQMARSITDAAKAYRRYSAAEDYDFHDVAAIFYERFGELVSQGKLASVEDDEDEEREASDKTAERVLYTEEVEKHGEYNLHIHKATRTRWNYFLKNPQGGGGGGMGQYPSKQSAIAAGMRGEFKGKDKVWVIESVFDYGMPSSVRDGEFGDYRVTKTYWLPVGGKQAAEQDDEIEAQFEEGKPADPTENMTEEDRKKWWEEHQKNKDKFKDAAMRELAAGSDDIRLIPISWSLASAEQKDGMDIIRMKEADFILQRVPSREASPNLNGLYQAALQILPGVGFDIDHPKGKSDPDRVEASFGDHAGTAGKWIWNVEDSTFRLVSRTPRPNFTEAIQRISHVVKVKPQTYNVGGEFGVIWSFGGKMAATADLSEEAIDTAFKQLSQALKHTALPTVGEKFRINVDPDEFMLIGGSGSGKEWKFKHRETQNYLLVAKDTGAIVVPSNPDKPGLQGTYDKTGSALAEAWGKTIIAAQTPTGLYGYTRKIQSDCETCIRKLEKSATKIARDIYRKDEATASFLAAHSRRTSSLPAKVILAAMKGLGPKVASQEIDQDLPVGWEKQAGKNYGLYGFSTRTTSLGLQACNTLHETAGHIASDLHSRRIDAHEHITGFFKRHGKEARCLYSRLLHASYPDLTAKTASVPQTVQEWIDFDV